MSSSTQKGAMARYFQQLSKVQWIWLFGSLVACVAIVAVGFVLEPKADEPLPTFTTAMSIKEIAPQLGVTGKSLARDLGLPLDAPKGKPLKKLGIDEEDLAHVTSHLFGHRAGPLKYYVFGALVLWGLVFLTRLGRPDGSPASERTTWYPLSIYLATLVVAVAVCGFALGKSPNPMEGAVKVFKSMVGLYPSVWEKVVALIFFLVLAIVGNKLVCGWACPFGALQELFYSLPFFRRIKRRKIPFWISNTIRAALFLVMLLLLFGVVGGRRGFVVYHSLNPFNLFNFEFDNVQIAGTIVVALALAFVAYRPFCQFICPFGFVSWLAERISLARIRIDRSRCNQCGACSQACPLDAAKHRVAGKVLAADCFSCGRCLNVCPQESISYGFTASNRSGQEEAAGASK